MTGILTSRHWLSTPTKDWMWAFGANDHIVRDWLDDRCANARLLLGGRLQRRKRVEVRTASTTVVRKRAKVAEGSSPNNFKILIPKFPIWKKPQRKAISHIVGLGSALGLVQRFLHRYRVRN
jgi:hypothetical protein